jgi:signal transduction histidine kinase/ABC-type uncharacterized transport system substrate-binding protein
MIPLAGRKTILFFILLICTPLSAKDVEKEVVDIILLNSYHSTFKWTKDLTQGVLEELQDNEGYRVSIEFMDAKRFYQDDHLAAFKTYIKEKYKTIEVNGIICSDNHAFEFYLKYGKDIWGDVPVVFCGVNNIRDFQIDTTKFNGIAEDIDIPSTIRLIDRILPELENLIVISDSTLSGIIFMNSFLSSVNKDYPDLNYSIINATSAEQLGRLLQQFNPEKTAIYLLSLYIPRNGATREMIQEAAFLKECLDVPVFGNWDFLFGDFILGGVIINGTDQGINAGRIMKRKLAGETLPFLIPTPKATILDYEQILKYNINPDLIPADAEFLNKPVPYVQQRKREITIGAVVFAFLLVIIIALSRILALKRTATNLLKKSESRLELAMDGANIGLWDANFNIRQIYLNKRISRLLDFQEIKDIYLTINKWPIFIHPDDVYQLKESFTMHQLNLAPVFSGEVRLKTGGDSYKWFLIHGQITEWMENKPIRMTGILMDIHFQKEFETQLRIAKERAEESDRLKSSFLANMSHEIRTPMNAILGFSDLLLNGDIDPDDSYQYIDMIRTSGESLLNLINDIIDISKIESGQFSLNHEPFDLHKLLDNIALVSKTMIANKQKPINFILNTEKSNDSFFIVSDPYRLEQIIYNLVNNAIKFTETGQIHLSYKSNGEMLHFSVKDTGIGIEPENHSLVFERFRQVDPGPKKNVSGTGLGLAISKSLVAMLGGNIQVNSEINCGADFTFTIPYITPDRITEKTN